MDNSIEIVKDKADVTQINKMIDDIHEETKRQQAEIEALDELDVLLKKLINVNHSRKEKTKAVKRRMRLLDQNL